MSEKTCMKRSRTGLANAWSVRLAPWSKAVESFGDHVLRDLREHRNEPE